MKNSGIEWIGEIPDSWEMIPNKHLFLDHSQKVGEKWTNYKLLSLTTSGVKEKDINSTGGKIPDSYENYQTVVPGDMVFCLFDLDCSAVFSGLSAHSGMITSAYDVFAVNDNLIDEKYIDYWFQYVFSNRYYKMYSKNIRYTVTGETFGATLTPVPPIKTQRKIGVFLKNKCAEVDKLIDIQQAQIDKLKEYKQSVITEAVTKGLDSTVPMKDSGVEWIGMIPESWNVVQLSSLFYEHKCKNLGMKATNLLSLSYGTIKRKNIATCDGLLPESFEGYNVIDNGDIVLRLTDLQNDQRSLRTGLSMEKGIVTSAYVTLRKRNLNVDVRFMHFFLHAFDVSKGFYGLGSGVRQGLNFDGIRKLTMLLPSIDEQIQIADYLDDKSAKIDKLIAIKQAKIDKLQEYKKSLIYEYVTGKKEVM